MSKCAFSRKEGIKSGFFLRLYDDVLHFLCLLLLVHLQFMTLQNRKKTKQATLTTTCLPFDALSSSATVRPFHLGLIPDHPNNPHTGQSEAVAMETAESGPKF